MNWIDQIYPELHGMARKRLQRLGRNDLTWTSDDLVQETWIRLQKQRTEPQNKGHALKIAALTLERTLRDYLRGRHTVTHLPTEFDLTGRSETGPVVDAATLCEAIERLTEVDPEAADVAVLKVYLEYPIKSIAELLELGHATVERAYQRAKTFLRVELQVV